MSTIVPSSYSTSIRRACDSATALTRAFCGEFRHFRGHAVVATSRSHTQTYGYRIRTSMTDEPKISAVYKDCVQHGWHDSKLRASMKPKRSACGVYILDARKERRTPYQNPPRRDRINGRLAARSQGRCSKWTCYTSLPSQPRYGVTVVSRITGVAWYVTLG